MNVNARTDVAAPAPQPAGPGIWAWPFLLALAFVGALALWQQWSASDDLAAERRTLLADALTLESRIADWLASERGAIEGLASALPARLDDETLLRQPAVVEGLRRLWVSVTVLDAGNRQLAHVPQQSPRLSLPPTASGVDDGGISAHLSRRLPDGGHLVVRYSPNALLRQTIPWWLARKYEVRLVDGLGQRLAGPSEQLPEAGRLRHVVSLEPDLTDSYLELTTRDARQPWWRGALVLLAAVFLLLSGGATWALRRRMLQVQQAEARSRTEAAWRRAIEDSLTVGLRARDLEGRIVHVNRAFCDLVGLAPPHLLGRLPPMPYWQPDMVEESMQRHRRNMAGGAPREGYEARWRRADGAPLEVMIFEAPLVDAEGRQIGWMGSIVDITARKQAEELERKRSEALAAQARLATLGEVASALAHQLNQPLTAIAGYNAGVLRSLERQPAIDPLLLDALRKLAQQAAEAGRIVQRIRAFLTRRSPQREPCALADIVAHALGLLQRDLKARGIEVTCRLADDLPAVEVDTVLVEQVLINLLRNAADALATLAAAAPQPGAADVPATAAAAGMRRIIRIGAQRAGAGFVRIDVDDSGPGLGGLGIDALTAPFYTTKAEGMGMGLAICRSVIEAHHGALEAGASATLGGARFSFTLPVVAHTAPRAESSDEPGAPTDTPEPKHAAQAA